MLNEKVLASVQSSGQATGVPTHQIHQTMSLWTCFVHRDTVMQDLLQTVAKKMYVQLLSH